MKIINKKHSAFTLAEVLITLGIIGIIAAMTIPTLMQKTQDAEFKTAWKKEFSVFSQANLNLVNENAGTLKGLCENNDGVCIRDNYAKYLKVIKTCDGSNIDGNCWPASWTRLNGDAPWSTPASAAGVVLSDGAFAVFSWLDKSCSYVDTGEMPVCGGISIDVNGVKKPNKIGKDIFSVHILSITIKPFGTPGDWTSINHYYDCDITKDGENCSADYLYK